MENDTSTRRYLPSVLWGAVIVFLFYVFFAQIIPNSSGISLTGKIFWDRLQELLTFLIAIIVGLALVEIYFYQIFFTQPKNNTAKIVTRIIQGGIALMAILAIITFFETTDLIKLGDGAIASFIRFPQTIYETIQNSAKGMTGGILAVILLALFAIIQYTSLPRNSKLGLAYLLILPAFLGILFLIIYPFMFEIKLAFSNASLGTQATKNASYGLIYGWENLVALFTGSVAKEAGFLEVFGRTITWTVINVVFHVTGGMVLALLLHRPMKLQGFYRTLLIFPWAVPSTIAVLALRNEFDNRYGLFNILLGRLQEFFANVAVTTQSVIGAGTLFAWLAATIGPVSWKQDPFWAFVSVLISNIWLGIPFMAVIILGGLQSISQEYYEAAEIDGANRWQMFWNITIPMLQPVLTPAIVLGFVWTFNKFEVIYLITQGGPQEKTDILVSSMYKAAFQFYRYGFTAMFALVIFAILLVFTIFYLRITGGLKSTTE